MASIASATGMPPCYAGEFFVTTDLELARTWRLGSRGRWSMRSLDLGPMCCRTPGAPAAHLWEQRWSRSSTRRAPRICTGALRATIWNVKQVSSGDLRDRTLRASVLTSWCEFVQMPSNACLFGGVRIIAEAEGAAARTEDWRPYPAPGSCGPATSTSAQAPVGSRPARHRRRREALCGTIRAPCPVSSMRRTKMAQDWRTLRGRRHTSRVGSYLPPGTSSRRAA